MLGSYTNSKSFHCDCCWKLECGGHFLGSGMSPVRPSWLFFIIILKTSENWMISKDSSKKCRFYSLHLRLSCLFLELNVQLSQSCSVKDTQIFRPFGFPVAVAMNWAAVISALTHCLSHFGGIQFVALVFLLDFLRSVWLPLWQNLALRISRYLIIATAQGDLWGCVVSCWWAVTTLWWRSETKLHRTVGNILLWRHVDELESLV